MGSMSAIKGNNTADDHLRFGANLKQHKLNNGQLKRLNWLETLVNTLLPQFSSMNYTNKCKFSMKI
jgi:hypothetical protein